MGVTPAHGALGGRGRVEVVVGGTVWAGVRAPAQRYLPPVPHCFLHTLFRAGPVPYGPVAASMLLLPRCSAALRHPSLADAFSTLTTPLPPALTAPVGTCPLPPLVSTLTPSTMLPSPSCPSLCLPCPDPRPPEDHHRGGGVQPQRPVAAHHPPAQGRLPRPGGGACVLGRGGVCIRGWGAAAHRPPA